MERKDRNKICKTCRHHKLDERYGLLCGLTDNFVNFENECKDYSKSISVEIPKKAYKSLPEKRKSKGLRGLFGIGISIWLLIKLAMLIFKFMTN